VKHEAAFEVPICKKLHETELKIYFQKVVATYNKAVV
jgi:hypothetical protein